MIRFWSVYLQNHININVFSIFNWWHEKLFAVLKGLNIQLLQPSGPQGQARVKSLTIYMYILFYSAILIYKKACRVRYMQPYVTRNELIVCGCRAKWLNFYTTPDMIQLNKPCLCTIKPDICWCWTVWIYLWKNYHVSHICPIHTDSPPLKSVPPSACNGSGGWHYRNTNETHDARTDLFNDALKLNSVDG